MHKDLILEFSRTLPTCWLGGWKKWLSLENVHGLFGRAVNDNILITFNSLFFFLMAIETNSCLKWNSILLSCSVVWVFATPRTIASRTSLSIPKLSELAQTHVQCRWCHPNILSFVIFFSSCLQSFPESGSFPMSQFYFFFFLFNILKYLSQCWYYSHIFVSACIWEIDTGHS